MSAGTVWSSPTIATAAPTPVSEWFYRWQAHDRVLRQIAARRARLRAHIKGAAITAALLAALAVEVRLFAAVSGLHL